MLTILQTHYLFLFRFPSGCVLVWFKALTAVYTLDFEGFHADYAFALVNFVWLNEFITVNDLLRILSQHLLALLFDELRLVLLRSWIWLTESCSTRRSFKLSLSRHQLYVSKTNAIWGHGSLSTGKVLIIWFWLSVLLMFIKVRILYLDSSRQHIIYWEMSRSSRMNIQTWFFLLRGLSSLIS